MGVKSATFRSAGQISQHYIPGAYSRIDTPAGDQGIASASNVVIIGSATGGEPQKIMWFNSINDANRTLRGGELRDAIRFALNGGSFNGSQLIPAQVGAIRANPATRASGNLKNSSSNIIDLKSKDYGLYTNQIKYTLADGTNSGKKLTIYLNAESEVWDDIEKESIKLQYTGDSGTAVLAITSTQLTITLGGTASTDGSVSITVDFATFDTIEKVVGYINSQTGYTAELVSDVNPEDASNKLDAVSGVDVKTSEVTANSDIEAMIDAINANSDYLVASKTSGTERLALDNVSDVYLSGGTEGSYDASALSDVLEYLETQNVQFIGETSGDYALQAAIKTHIATMNAVTGKRERQAIFGAISGSTLDQAIAEAKIKNDPAIAMAFGKMKDYDVNDNLVEYSSVYFAAKCLGMFGAIDINQPLTHKTVNAVSLETELSDADIEKAIKGGLIVPEYTNTGIVRVVRSVSTYQQANLIKNEFSMWRTALFISRDLRSFIEERFTAAVGDTNVIASIETAVKSRLRDTYEQDLSLLVSNPAWDNQAFKNIIININGDQVDIFWDGTIVAPLNFQFITNNFSVIASL